ncbi:MAG: cell division protein FtsQ/DivIB [Chitinophagaceae bacterium]
MQRFKKIVTIGLWCIIAIATIAALVAAMQRQESALCNGAVVTINGDNQLLFVQEKDVLTMLNKVGLVKGQSLGRINIRRMEAVLRTNPWIANAQLFIDNNHFLQVHIQEREPIARVFTLQGNSFYIDSSGNILPLSEHVTARVPVFTSFPSNRAILSHSDSMVLNDIKLLAKYIVADSFFLAQTSQIDILPQGEYEWIPTLGNQVVTIGNSDSLNAKFNRLYSFYKHVWAKQAFEKYERIDVRYNGQVVAIRRGAQSPVADTAKAMLQLKAVMQQTNQVSNTVALTYVNDKPKPADSVAGNKLKQKTITTTNNKPTSIQPKALMPSKN